MNICFIRGVQVYNIWYEDDHISLFLLEQHTSLEGSYYLAVLHSLWEGHFQKLNKKIF